MTLEKGDVAISQHVYAFRYGKPYTVLNIQDYKDRPCFFVQFEDGVIDWFPVSDLKTHNVHKVATKEESQ